MDAGAGDDPAASQADCDVLPLHYPAAALQHIFKQLDHIYFISVHDIGSTVRESTKLLTYGKATLEKLGRLHPNLLTVEARGITPTGQRRNKNSFLSTFELNIRITYTNQFFISFGDGHHPIKSYSPICILTKKKKKVKYIS